MSGVPLSVPISRERTPTGPRTSGRSLAPGGCNTATVVGATVRLMSAVYALADLVDVGDVPDVVAEAVDDLPSDVAAAIEPAVHSIQDASPQRVKQRDDDRPQRHHEPVLRRVDR